MKYAQSLIALWFVVSFTSSFADDFFEIAHVHFYDNQPATGATVIKLVEQKDSDGNRHGVQMFCPFLEVGIKVKKAVASNAVVAKVYFYNDEKAIISSVTKPDIAIRNYNQRYDWPEILPSDSDNLIYFAVPDAVLSHREWSAVVIFGDSQGIDAKLYRGVNKDLYGYNFSEKPYIEDKEGPPLVRKFAVDNIVETQVQTFNLKQPQLTLFLKRPLGLQNFSQAHGVLALALLADSAEGVKRQLQGFERLDELSGPLKFAAENKLLVIGWGSTSLWDPKKNWDDQNEDVTYSTDRDFDQIAAAWEKGVKNFVNTYNIPSSEYLLWGESGSAQYACRLALRKPEYFLAVHAHIPSSFDRPSPAGAKVFWCLTTGEEEAGYSRSLRFYHQCRILGYPMIFKAFVGLGHSWNLNSEDLGLKFFQYALTIRKEREDFDKMMSDPLAQFRPNQTTSNSYSTWAAGFKTPDYIGDIVNQAAFPSSQAACVPDDFQTPLPTRDLADAWIK